MRSPPRSPDSTTTSSSTVRPISACSPSTVCASPTDTSSPTIPDILSTYGIPQLQSRVAKFGERVGHPIREIGLVITKYRSASNLHRSTIERLQRDERIANVVPAWIPEATQIAQSAEFVPYGTLKRKYGTSGQYDALRMLTEDVLMNAQVLL